MQRIEKNKVAVLEAAGRRWGRRGERTAFMEGRWGGGLGRAPQGGFEVHRRGPRGRGCVVKDWCYLVICRVSPSGRQQGGGCACDSPPLP